MQGARAPAESRVLVAVDSPALAQTVSAQLRTEGADPRAAEGCDGAQGVLAAPRCDLIILETGFAGLDNVETLRRLRASGSATLVMVLSSSPAAGDRVAGLDAGADDWMTVPFHAAEFGARVRALLRRRGSRVTDVIRRAGLTFDAVRRVARVHGDPVVLSPREAGLLRMLLVAASGVVTRERILDEFYGLGESAGANTVEVYVSRLRRKLAGSGVTIRSVHGRGYAIEARG